MLTTKQAAEKINMKETTLEAWRCRGGGPVFVKMGKAVRYREEDLAAYISERLRSNTSQAA